MKKMAKPQIAAPLAASPVAVNSSLFPPKELTPFSAVAPARFLTVHRLHVHMSLETIYEEETSEVDEFVELSQASSSSPPSFMSSSMCFLEVHKPFSSSYGHNCQCA